MPEPLVARIPLPLALAFCLGLAATAAAQPGGANGRGMLIRNFEQNAPAVGELMPNVPVYDRDGGEHLLADVLAGRPTVLILGCLT